MYKPEGIYVAMLTPFHDDGSINEDELRRIVDFQIEAGVGGLFPVSSVGEFIHMNREEKVRMMAIVMEQNAGRVCVTPGVGSSFPAESIALAKKAKELGCDGVVVAPPYFFPQSQENIEKYFEPLRMRWISPISSITFHYLHNHSLTISSNVYQDAKILSG